MRALAGALLRSPGVVARAIPWTAGKLWRMKADLLAARGRARKLSFFIHDVMGAGCLDCERIGACVFMVATHDGPISMCLHKARRGEFILRPVQAAQGGWRNPLTGQISVGAGGPPGHRQPKVTHTRKTLKGPLKEHAAK